MHSNSILNEDIANLGKARVPQAYHVHHRLTICTTGLFLILLARWAYLKVFKVSCTTYEDGEIHAIWN